MNTCAKRLRIPAISLILAALVLLPSHVAVKAGNPAGAYYSADTDKVFWFIHASDIHMGMRGTNDSSRLQWLVTTARSVINPSFIVVTGDLTDSTNGNLFGIPNGPYQAEWDQYKKILSDAKAGPDIYYDLPGNHDAYSDRDFTYYLANSVQGLATKQTQLSWTREFLFGEYHFLGVNSADNTGAAFSLSWPWGDYAGLDAGELSFISGELAEHADADLTMVFGHHPVTDTGASDDTWLYYGHEEFIQALDDRRASSYSFGHTHDSSQALFTGDDYTGPMIGGGIHYYNVASLGKSSASNFSLVAIDCNGVSSVTRTWGTWPVVLITAPVDRSIGGAANPYAYKVPAASANPVRALVFDAKAVSQVSYRIDGGATWYPMSRVAANPALWHTTWNAASLAAGNHTIEVRAVGSTTVSDVITVEVEAGATNHAPVAVADSYSVDSGKTLSPAAPGVLANDSDPDGDALTAVLVSPPAHAQWFVLNDNGSFTYTPASGYTGDDSFTYAASDGTLSSNTATAAITVTAPPAADTVTIPTATWVKKTKILTVEATSTQAPDAVLTISNYNAVMTYDGSRKLYIYQKKTVTKPVTVTVVSDLGGSATKTVTAQ